MFFTNTLQYLTYQWRSSRVGETLFLVPAGEGSQPQLQGVESKCLGVISEVSCHAVSRGWQKAAPGYLVMFNCSLVTAASIRAGGRMLVELNGTHLGPTFFRMTIGVYQTTLCSKKGF